MIIPDENPKSILDINFIDLYSKGYRGIMVDVDNTVATVYKHKISEEIQELFHRLHEIGYRTVILSNNKNERMVNEVAAALDSLYVYDSHKPHREGFMKALDLLGTEKEQTMIIGDEYHADGIGGKKFGLYTILVEPINATSDFLWMGWDRLMAVLPKIVAQKSEIESPVSGDIRVDVLDTQRHLLGLYKEYGAQKFNEAIRTYEANVASNMDIGSFTVKEICPEEDISELVSKYGLTDLCSLGQFLDAFINEQTCTYIEECITSNGAIPERKLEKYHEPLAHRLMKMAESRALGMLNEAAEEGKVTKSILKLLPINESIKQVMGELLKADKIEKVLDKLIIDLIKQMEGHNYLKLHHRYIKAYLASDQEIQRAQQLFCNHEDRRAYEVFALSIYDNIPGVNYLRASCMLKGRGCKKDVDGAIRLLKSSEKSSLACKSLLARCYLQGKVNGGIREEDRAYELAADVLKKKDTPDSDIDGIGEYLYDLAYFCGQYVMKKEGDKEKAKEYYNMSIKMKGYRYAYKELGDIYKSEGNESQSQEYYRNAEKHGMPTKRKIEQSATN